MEVTTKLEYPKDWSRHGYPDSDDEGPSLNLNSEQTAFADTYALQQGDPPAYGSKWAQPLEHHDLTTEFLEDATSVPAPNRLVAGSRHMNPRPKRPHDIQNLEIGGRNIAEVGWFQSVPEPGYTRIDTSGNTKTLTDWDDYREALRAEA
ncbi:hypothetical protein N0V91_003665 [Didymella pomorum]|uniref:Uncharacterized protein n=1 Tax=Didymella pomorum TaxID=749634 RepID=A0A9W8ZHW8_9PLEO|nr:hypothetical protein N0V91_003665 [Didymella pomorum]